MTNQPFAQVQTSNEPPKIPQAEIERQIRDLDKRITAKGKEMAKAKKIHDQNLIEAREYREMLMKLEKAVVTNDYARLSEEEASLMSQRMKLEMQLGGKKISKELLEAAGVTSDEDPEDEKV